MRLDAPSNRRLSVANVCATLLLLLALVQITGYLVGVRAIRGLGACTAASPFPRVFSSVDGLETFATDFTLVYEHDGRTVSVAITPELYRQLKGPYWRRNVYGAALAYGPRLPRHVWETIFCYGLEPGGAFHDEFGVPENAVRVRVDIGARTSDETWTLEPACTE